MKGYKPFYLFSLIILYGELMFIALPSLLVLSIVFSISKQTNFFEILFKILGVLVLLILLICIFVFLVNIIISPFKKKKVYIDANHIAYNGIKINFEDIKYITLYLPMIRGRTSSSPLELSVYCDMNNHIVIKRPSIFLLLELKKRAKSIKINELNKRIKFDLIIGISVAVILLVFILIVLNQ